MWQPYKTLFIREANFGSFMRVPGTDVGRDADSAASSFYSGDRDEMGVRRSVDEEAHFSSDSGHYSWGSNIPSEPVDQFLYDEHVYETIEDFCKVNNATVSKVLYVNESRTCDPAVYTGDASCNKDTPPDLPPRNPPSLNQDKRKQESKSKSAAEKAKASDSSHRPAGTVSLREVVNAGSNHVYTVEDVFKTLADYVSHLPPEEKLHFKQSHPCSQDITSTPVRSSQALNCVPQKLTFSPMTPVLLSKSECRLSRSQSDMLRHRPNVGLRGVAALRDKINAKTGISADQYAGSRGLDLDFDTCNNLLRTRCEAMFRKKFRHCHANLGDEFDLSTCNSSGSSNVKQNCTANSAERCELSEDTQCTTDTSLLPALPGVFV